MDHDYDAMTPLLQEGFQMRFAELSEAVAIIYSTNFSVDDLRTLVAFYNTPTGQKLLQKSPVVMQQSMTAGQKFGQSVQPTCASGSSTSYARRLRFLELVLP